MEKEGLDPRLRLVQQAEMKDKVVLIRVDHNVVKKGQIKDPYRIDASWWTLYAIAEKGGRPILMTHIGRPRDKKTGHIKCDDGQSVLPIVRYLERKLPVEIHVPRIPPDPEKGILHLDSSIEHAIKDLKQGKIGMIYLPNTRWFRGEEAKGPEREAFVEELASIADLYVNNAFGSWQAHASTYDVARRLPSYAGILLQKELQNLHRVLDPEKPFVAVIAGSKYDTKIGPLKSLYREVDHLILGGLMYNTFLSAKYGIRIAGVSEEDRQLAME
ncbi:MAG: phosphoglycerate kinase, partial [Deltaproteobacteria bacterium]